MEPDTSANPEPILVPDQPISEPKKSLPKWPLIIVGVILLATLLTGTYLLGKNQGVNQKPTLKTAQTPAPTVTPTSTPNPAANWQTYINTQYGYSVKYPLNWAVVNATEVPITIKANDAYLSVPNDPEPISYWININYILNPQKSDFKTIATKDLPQNMKDALTYTKETINGITAYRTTSLPSRSGCEWVYFQDFQDNFVTLNFCLYNKDKPFTHQAEHYSDFNTMLSSFKFTDQTSQQAPAQNLISSSVTANGVTATITPNHGTKGTGVFVKITGITDTTNLAIFFQDAGGGIPATGLAITPSQVKNGTFTGIYHSL